MKENPVSNMLLAVTYDWQILHFRTLPSLLHIGGSFCVVKFSNNSNNSALAGHLTAKDVRPENQEWFMSLSILTLLNIGGRASLHLHTVQLPKTSANVPHKPLPTQSKGFGHRGCPNRVSAEALPWNYLLFISNFIGNLMSFAFPAI